MKKQKHHVNLWVMITALCLCLISAVVSNLIVTSGGTVRVENVEVITDYGVIRGYLLVPKNVTSTNKAPGIVVSHGSSASAETVDSWYVELARRGYVIFAPNMYGHGDSTIIDAAGDGSVSDNTNGLYDAVEYIASLPYVDTEKVGIMGHSLGGGKSMAVAEHYTKIENEALAAGATAEDAHALNKIDAILTVGYPLEAIVEGLPSVSSPPFKGYNANVGVILGKADDFQSWMNKDVLINGFGSSWLETQTGVVLSEVVEGEFYTSNETGYQFAIWNPNEIHNGNLLSTKTTSYVVDFFEGIWGAPNPIESNNQIWWIKQVFNFIGMCGFFLFVIPCLYYVLKIPVFQSLERENTFVLPPLLGDARKKYLKSIFTGVLINTITFIPFVLVGLLALESPLFPQSSTNGFMFWGIACAVSTLLAVRRGTGLKYKENAEYFGFKTNKNELLKAFALSFTVVTCTYMLLFAAKYFFNSDFRFWSYAIRSFTPNKLTIALRYLPVFFILQFANGIAIRRNNFDNWSDNKRIAFSTTMAIIPVSVILCIAYIPILFTGSPTFGMDGSNLILLAAGQSAIKCVTYLFSVGLTSFIHVKSQKYTGNIWVGALINTFLITMINVANCNFLTAW